DDWTQVYGGGSGTLGINDGSAHWNEVGGGTRLCRAIHETPLPGNNMAVRLVVAEGISFVSTPPFLELLGRSDATIDNCVVARLKRTMVAIGSVLGGSDTQFESISHSKTAGVWEFICGADADPDEFGLLYNGEVKLTATDSGA